MPGDHQANQSASPQANIEAFDSAPAEVRSFLPDLKCSALLLSPIGAQAVVAIKAAKQAGLIRDEEHCISLAGDAGRLGEVLGGPVAGLIAGETAKCACKVVF